MYSQKQEGKVVQLRNQVLMGAKLLLSLGHPLSVVYFVLYVRHIEIGRDTDIDMELSNSPKTLSGYHGKIFTRSRQIHYAERTSQLEIMPSKSGLLF